MLAGLFIAAGMIAIGLVAAYRARITIPITAIAETGDATLVRIRGEANGEQPLRAPYSGRACVYYKLEVTFAQFNRRERLEHSERCDLSVTDDTGVARVQSAKAAFEVAPCAGEATRASRLSERAREVLRERGWGVPEIAAVTIAESVIAVGDIVDVAGTPVREARADDVVERGFRDAPLTLMFSGEVYVRGVGARKAVAS